MRLVDREELYKSPERKDIKSRIVKGYQAITRNRLKKATEELRQIIRAKSSINSSHARVDNLQQSDDYLSHYKSKQKEVVANFGDSIVKS